MVQITGLDYMDNLSLIVTFLTGILGAAISPVVDHLLRLQRLRTGSARPDQPRKSAVSTAALAAFGGLLGIFVGYFALAPVISGPVTPSARVSITSPSPSSRVSRIIVVQGNVSNLGKQDLWLLVLPEGTTPYHPQPGPIAVNSDGSWSSSIYVGAEDPQDIGRSFVITAALTESKGTQQFQNYLRKAQLDGRYPGIDPLPPEIKPAAQVTVVREK